MATSKLLKDLYDEKLISSLSSEMIKVHSSFNTRKFTQRIFDESWNSKELKQRMRHISQALHEFLPDDFSKAVNILKPVSEKFSGFEYMFFQDYVELYGLDDFNESMVALECFTKYASSEFAQKMMRQMEKWAESDNHHVRRLASEGSRPRLPWAMALPEFKKNPAPVIKILNKLKNDQSEYVRRSVSNNLNDISKDNPDVTLKIAKAWKGKNKNTDWIVKHACRTLLKGSNESALGLFGFGNPKSIQLLGLKVSKKVKMGGEIEFSFGLKSSRKNLGMLRIEYAIEFTRANGRTGKKVFKISEGDFKGSSKDVVKSYSFKPITTRRYYPGVHSISILINGKEMAKTQFNLC